MRRVAVVLAAFVALVRPVPAAADPSTAVTYRPPVDAPLVDWFRPPPEPWAAGNRGIDYATTRGSPVSAAAAGEVVFAGPVAGTLHVVVLHDDGIRTSYSFLKSVAVRRGDRVDGGQAVGTAGERLHFGARAGDTYLDPARLLGGGPPEVHLVPDEQRRPATEERERAGLVRSLTGLASRLTGAGADALAWARDTGTEAVREFTDYAWAQALGRFDEATGLAQYAWNLNPTAYLARLGRAGLDYLEQKDNCTPAEVGAPVMQQRHIAVTVGGLDSTSAQGGSPIDALDTAALGYGGGDIVRFSYAGEDGATTHEAPYDGRDTSQDIRESARRLRALLERLERDHPGVPIDIVTHSSGGIVARQALAGETDPGDPTLPPINALVTLAAPQTGADLATALTMAGQTAVGQVGEAGVDALRPDHATLSGESVRQLSESSRFLFWLNRTSLPAGVKVTSIGARGDLMVPARHTRLEGAKNIVLTVPGVLDQHSTLPGTPQATREVALAVAGMAPTCQTLADMVTDLAVSEVISQAEDALGLMAWFGGRRVDRGITPTLPDKIEVTKK